MNIHTKTEKILEYLNNDICKGIPFYISGGYALSHARNRNDYNDIDVFFYNEDDFNVVKNSVSYIQIEKHDIVLEETSNAITIAARLDDGSIFENIQLCKYFGDAHDAHRKMDFKQCGICITNTGEVITNGIDKNIITSNPNAFKFSVMPRYLKYRVFKELRDDNFVALHTIIDFIVENFYKEYDMFYVNKKQMLGNSLNCILRKINEGNKQLVLEIIQEIHDYILENHPHIRTMFFYKMFELYYVNTNNPIKCINKPSDICISIIYSCAMKNGLEKHKTLEDMYGISFLSCKQKYPELFI